MRILFITIAFAPNEFSESIVNSKLVLALIEAGHLVDVISKGKNGPTYSSSWNMPWNSLKSNTYIIDYNLENRVMRLFDYLKCSIQFLYPLKGIRWIKRAFMKAETLIKIYNYDIVITRSPSDIPHIVGLTLKKKYDLPWVANWNDPCEGIWPEPYKNNSNLIFKLISNYYNSKVLRNADYNTFPSDRLRAKFSSRFNINLEKSEIIPHIGLDFFNNAQHFNLDHSLTICHAGNLSDERNPEILFSAISKLKLDFNDENIIKFTLIGSANQKIEELIHKFKLQENIFIIGSKSYIETLALMQQFDILCIVEAKLKEGIFMPSKLSDYVFLKKPILCFSPSKGTLADIINKFGGGLVVNNENELSVDLGLKSLIKCKKENKLSMIFENHQLVAYLSKENVLDKYQCIFNKIGTKILSRSKP